MIDYNELSIKDKSLLIYNEINLKILFLYYELENNTKIKLLILKKINKISLSYEDSKKLLSYYTKEHNPSIKSEIISILGKLKDEKYIPFLISLLKTENGIVLNQVIRALLFFKNIDEVENELSYFLLHPNEILNNIVKKEIYNIKNDIKSNLIDSSLILHGDSEYTLLSLPSQSIDLTITSPPYYNAKEYVSYSDYDTYLNKMLSIFNIVHRLTKEGRFLIVNSSPIIEKRFSRNHNSKRYPIPYDLNYLLCRNGWDFIDDIVWVKPEGSVYSRISTFLKNRKPLTYKPNLVTESVMVYRKKTDKPIDWNIKNKNEKIIGNIDTTNVWKISPSKHKKHNAIFPAILIEKLIKYYSYENDVILDPFAGSGTVGKVCKEFGRKFVLSEFNQTYVNLIKEELKI